MLYQIHVVPVPLRMLLYSVLEIMLCSIILNTESKWKLACSFIAQYWLRVTTTDSELFVWYSNIWSCWDFLSQWTSGLIVSLSFLLKVNLFLSGILMNMLWLVDICTYTYILLLYIFVLHCCYVIISVGSDFLMSSKLE